VVGPRVDRQEQLRSEQAAPAIAGYSEITARALDLQRSTSKVWTGSWTTEATDPPCFQERGEIDEHLKREGPMVMPWHPTTLFFQSLARTYIAALGHLGGGPERRGPLLRRAQAI